MFKGNRRKYNLQFFAEGDPQESAGDNPESGQDDDSSQGGQDDQSGGNEKKFTQEEVNRMMTREKRQGKMSVLKSLGFKTEDEAKNALKLLNALVDSQKTPEDKAKDVSAKAVEEKNDAEQRALMAENKLSCVMAGVNKDSIDDVLAIALGKVTEEKPIDKVLAEMKKEKRYSSFFEEDKGGSGTGSKPENKPAGGGSKAGSYGATLAKGVVYQPNAKTKKTYFGED